MRSLPLLPALALLAGASPDSRPRAEALQLDLERYDALGVKRTGTTGERRTLDWIGRELGRAGFEVTSVPFRTPTASWTRAELAVGGRRIRGMPLFRPVFTGRAGAQGRLIGWDGGALPTGARGAIAVLALPDRRHSSARLSFAGVDFAAAERAGVAGVVVATRNPTGELVALNADWPAAPPRVPVLLVPGREAAGLAAASGSVARLVTTGSVNERATSRNVFAARRAGPRWIVVSTPVSGWFAAAAERGPGVAILLDLARRVSALAPCDSILLVATSGHEGGYGGMAAALDSGTVPPPNAVRLWVHLGAGLAAWGDEARTAPETQRYLLTTDAIAGAARRAFAGLPGYATPATVTAETAVGEGETVLRRGYPNLVAGVSAHLYHHTPRDRADRTSGTLVEPVARAFERLISEGTDRGCVR